MMDFFNSQKKNIELLLKEFFSKKQSSFREINKWGGDVLKRLYSFTSAGKMIRGGLVVLFFRLYSKGNVDDALRAGAAMELFQSAFLIHDDIMDRDNMRRGKPSFFYQYGLLGERNAFSDPIHFGESMGICAGDLSFFLGFEMLSSMKANPEIVRRAIDMCTEEIGFVTIAQMQDVYFGNLKESPEEKDILKLYLYKTGRYTFSLPMKLGALLAGRDEEILAKIERIGNLLGIIFQIKDDEIGLFGEESEIGKPVGSDIKENKKSFYLYYLEKSASTRQRTRLKNILTSGKVSVKDISFIRDMILELEINKKINSKMNEMISQSRTLIEELPVSYPEYRGILEGLLDYSLNRNK